MVEKEGIHNKAKLGESIKFNIPLAVCMFWTLKSNIPLSNVLLCSVFEKRKSIKND